MRRTTIGLALCGGLVFTMAAACPEDEDCPPAEQLNNECAPEPEIGTGDYGPNGDQGW